MDGGDALPDAKTGRGECGDELECARQSAMPLGLYAYCRLGYAFVVCPKGSSNPGTESPGAQRNRK
jgi:hypothetical protein